MAPSVYPGPHTGRVRERLILRAAETHRGCQLEAQEGTERAKQRTEKREVI